MENYIFIFVGEGSNFPSGVFNDISKANQWIKNYSLTGTLTSYPVDAGVYDWAIEKGYFEVKKDYQKGSNFIGKFTSAYLEHIHFTNGKED